MALGMEQRRCQRMLDEARRRLGVQLGRRRRPSRVRHGATTVPGLLPRLLGRRRRRRRRLLLSHAHGSLDQLGRVRVRARVRAGARVRVRCASACLWRRLWGEYV